MVSAEISLSAYRLAIVIVVTCLALPAMAGERKRLHLPEQVAQQRVLQLSPGSGINPGYQRPQLVKPYESGRVIFTGKTPVAVEPQNSTALQPTGSFRPRNWHTSGSLLTKP